jgi:hypothetical protein|tara:strand:+ start:2529 stop:3173 length:645 start_codon:yes stop_codon:yes gene_type:complete
MANTNGAWGLKPVAKMGQNSNSTGVSGYTQYEIANANSNVIYFGSPVIPLSTGYIDIVGAAAGGTVGLLGAFMGCRYVASTTGKPTWSNYWPGSGADSNHPIRAFVADDPMQIFSIATDATWTSKATARAAVFANTAFDSGTSGSTTTGMSSAKLDIGTIGTTDTLNLRILGWEEDPLNQDFTAAGIPALVRLNNHYNSANGAIAAGTVSTTGV